MYICAVYLYKWLVCCSQKISINQVQKKKKKKKNLVILMININTLCLEDTNIHLGDLDTKQPKKLNLSYKYKSSKDRLLSQLPVS